MTWLNANSTKADFLFLADRGIVGNGRMLMLEDGAATRSPASILDWLDDARTRPHRAS